MSEHSDISALVPHSFHPSEGEGQEEGVRREGRGYRRKRKKRRGRERRKNVACCVYYSQCLAQSYIIALNLYKNLLKLVFYIFFPNIQLRKLRLKEVIFLVHSYTASTRATPKPVFLPLHKTDSHAVTYFPVFFLMDTANVTLNFILFL